MLDRNDFKQNSEYFSVFQFISSALDQQLIFKEAAITLVRAFRSRREAISRAYLKDWKLGGKPQTKTPRLSLITGPNLKERNLYTGTCSGELSAKSCSSAQIWPVLAAPGCDSHSHGVFVDGRKVAGVFQKLFRHMGVVVWRCYFYTFFFPL